MPHSILTEKQLRDALLARLRKAEVVLLSKQAALVEAAGALTKARKGTAGPVPLGALEEAAVAFTNARHSLGRATKAWGDFNRSRAVRALAKAEG